MMLPVALSIADEISCSKKTRRLLAVVFCILNIVQIFLTAFVCHVFGMMLLYWVAEPIIALLSGLLIYYTFCGGDEE